MICIEFCTFFRLQGESNYVEIMACGDITLFCIDFELCLVATMLRGTKKTGTTWRDW